MLYIYIRAPRFCASLLFVQPFAWASREFLRRRVIGKSVRFRVEYRVESIKRDFGAIFLDEENVGLSVAREGWARVKPLEQCRDGVSEVGVMLYLSSNRLLLFYAHGDGAAVVGGRAV